MSYVQLLVGGDTADVGDDAGNQEILNPSDLGISGETSAGGSDIMRTTGSEILHTMEDKEMEEFSSEDLNHAQALLKSADLDRSLKSVLGACLKRVIQAGDRLNPLNLIRQEVEYHFSDFFLATSSDDWARRVTDGHFVPLSTISTLKRVQDLTSNLIAKSLQTSSKIVVDQHRQQIRLKDPIDKTVMDELKSRIIVVELTGTTDDESGESLKKLFSKFGKVIRVHTCKFFGTPIAFVEFEEVDGAIEATLLLKKVYPGIQLLKDWGQTSNNEHSINDVTQTHCAGLQIPGPGLTLGQTSNDDDDHSLDDFARTHCAGLGIPRSTLVIAKTYYESLKDRFKEMIKEEMMKMSVFIAAVEDDFPFTSRELGIKEGPMKKKKSMVAHLKADPKVVIEKDGVVLPSKIAARYCLQLGIENQELGRICRAAGRVSSIDLGYKPKEDTVACAVILTAKAGWMEKISQVSGLKSKTITKLHKELEGHQVMLFREDGADGASAQ